MYKYYIISSLEYEGREITECSSKDECEDELSNKSIYNHIIEKVIYGKEVKFTPKSVVTRYEIED